MLRRADWVALGLSIGAWRRDDQVTNQHVSRPQLLAYTRVVHPYQPIVNIDLLVAHHFVLELGSFPVVSRKPL